MTAGDLKERPSRLQTVLTQEALVTLLEIENPLLMRTNEELLSRSSETTTSGGRLTKRVVKYALSYCL